MKELYFIQTSKVKPLRKSLQKRSNHFWFEWLSVGELLSLVLPEPRETVVAALTQCPHLLSKDVQREITYKKIV